MRPKKKTAKAEEPEVVYPFNLPTPVLEPFEQRAQTAPTDARGAMNGSVEDMIERLRRQLSARSEELKEEAKEDAPLLSDRTLQARSERFAAAERRAAEWKAAMKKGELPEIPLPYKNSCGENDADGLPRFFKERGGSSSTMTIFPEQMHVKTVPEKEPFGARSNSVLAEERLSSFHSRIRHYAFLKPKSSDAAGAVNPGLTTAAAAADGDQATPNGDSTPMGANKDWGKGLGGVWVPEIVFQRSAASSATSKAPTPPLGGGSSPIVSISASATLDGQSMLGTDVKSAFATSGERAPTPPILVNPTVTPAAGSGETISVPIPMVSGAAPVTPGRGGNVGRLRAATASALANRDRVTCLEFESRFESGNLRQAVRVGLSEYDLQLSNDTNTVGHTQWFYFRVNGIKAGVAYTFNILNMYKSDSLSNFGQQPLVYSRRREREEGIGWYRAGERVCYYGNGLCRNWDNERGLKILREADKNNSEGLLAGISGDLHTMAWTITFEQDEDEVFFAQGHPYTYSELQRYFKQLEQTQGMETKMRRWQMCETLAGNNCDCLTITSFSLTSNVKERKGIFLTSRVHPGETGGSFMIKGAIDFLVSDCPEAESLRNNFVFKIIPMLNPDGVINGNYRTSLSGHDLNRRWTAPSMILHPTIYNAKIILRRLCEDREVVLFCDFHGHSRKFNTFMYGCDPKYIKPSQRFQTPPISVKYLPKLLETLTGNSIHYPNCSFKVQASKESCARINVWREFGIRCSYTLEASMCGASMGERAGNHYGPQDLEFIGISVCRAILQMWGPNSVPMVEDLPDPEDAGPEAAGWVGGDDGEDDSSGDDDKKQTETPKKRPPKSKGKPPVTPTPKPLPKPPNSKRVSVKKEEKPKERRADPAQHLSATTSFVSADGILMISRATQTTPLPFGPQPPFKQAAISAAPTSWSSNPLLLRRSQTADRSGSNNRTSGFVVGGSATPFQSPSPASAKSRSRVFVSPSERAGAQRTPSSPIVSAGSTDWYKSGKFTNWMSQQQRDDQ